MHLSLPAPGTVDIWHGKADRQNSSAPPFRAQLREWLSLYLDGDASKIAVAADHLGKPTIVDCPIDRMSFSVSYARSWVFVAIGLGPLGVDAEVEDERVRLHDVARRWLHPHDARRIGEAPASERTFRFFQAWTLRESYLKALGTGFRHDERAHAIVPCTSAALPAQPLVLGHVALGHADLGTCHLSVASEAPPCRFTFRGPGRHAVAATVTFSTFEDAAAPQCATPTAWRVQ